MTTIFPSAKQTVVTTTLFLLFIGCLTTVAQTSTDARISAIREQSAKTMGPDRYGSAYAALISSAVNPDISTATYDIKAANVNDPTLRVIRVPLRHVFNPDKPGARPFVEATLTHQTYDISVDIAPDESVQNEWRADGGTFGGGMELPVTTELTVVPSLHAGLVRLESDASYRGEVSNTILRPALQGIVFDWVVDAGIAGASLWTEYKHSCKNFDLNLAAGLSHNYVETLSSSSGLIDFSSQATTVGAQAETVHPLGKSLAGCPLALVVNAGNTTFLGDARDALGFNYYFDTGLALETDLSGKVWSISKLRLGAKVIYGEDVTGWSLIMGYRF